jgi:flagellar biosynthesis protein FlhB
VVHACWSWAYNIFQRSTEELLGSLHLAATTASQRWIEGSVASFAAFVLPVGLACICATLASGFSQTRGLITGKPLAPDLTKLNPLPKLKQMLASKDAALSLLQAAGKVAVIGTVSVHAYTSELPRLTGLGQHEAPEIAAELGSVVARVGLRIGVLLGLFALLDLFLTRRRLEEQMKMSKKEIRDEHREHEGDPEVKRRQRAQARKLGQNRMLASVPKADVVLVNPTHYAVALSYEPGVMRAPNMTAKGADHLAARIRDIAREHRVPVVHNPPLTRSLYADCEVGEEIPGALYTAVAEVLAVVYRMRNPGALS